MRRADAPDLIALAVAVVLVVALAAAARRQAHTQLVRRTERMAVQRRGTPFMVGRAVDDDGVHAVRLLVIQVGLRVEVAVGAVQRQFRQQPVRQRDVDTARARVIHILIHARLHLRTTVAHISLRHAWRNLAFRHVHQCYHPVELVQIPRNGCRKAPSAILHVGRVIVTGLGIEVDVADIEERAAAHDVEIAVVQLLDGRRLKALTPTQTEAEIADGGHRADLRRQTESEVMIVHQSKTGSYVCGNAIATYIMPLVLHIHGTRPVVGRSRLRALGSFQVVVAVFRTGIQHIVVRQIEDALQLCHHALLVALQLALTGHHRHREPLAVLVAILLALQQHVVVVFCRIVVIVGVLVPVHVQRDIIPFATHRCRRIVVAQVVGIDVATGVTAVLRAQDILLIVRTFGIQLQPLYRLIGQSFGHLPVTVFVHRLVPTVRQHHALGPFLGGILPSVVALQLEVRLAVEFAQGECHCVMLAQVVMCAVARAVVHIETSLAVLLRNDIDDTCHCVAAV